MEMSASQRKEYIVIIAIDLIHEKGIHNISTKEIARRLNISESLIFKLFPKKNDIIMAVLEQFSFYDKDMFVTATNKNEDAKDAILFYINSYLIYYENYPAVTAVYQMYDTFKKEPELENKSISIFLNRKEDMRKMVKKAQDTDRINKTIDSEVIADIITSTVRGMCLKWRMTNFNFSLREKTIYAVKIILDAFTI
jgi:AcrR family transcriptional regulator